MTLVIAAAYRGALWQVTDRLTTIATDGTPHDDEANKTIIVHLREAMVFIGYSGVAYMQGIPTDTWLAAAVAGIPWEHPHRLQGTPDLAGVNFGLLVRRLRVALDRRGRLMSARERSNFGLCVQLVGMRRSLHPNGRPRAVYARMVSEAPSPRDVRLEFSRVGPSWWAHSPGHEPRPFVRMVPDHGPRRITLEKVLADPVAVESMAAFHNTHINAVVAMAHLTPTIGGDVQITRFCPGEARDKIRVEYAPFRTGYTPMTWRGLTAPTVRSPWYLTQCGVLGPQVSTGMEMSTGDGMWLDVQRPRGDQGLPFIMGTQLQGRQHPPR